MDDPISSSSPTTAISTTSADLIDQFRLKASLNFNENEDAHHHVQQQQHNDVKEEAAAVVVQNEIVKDDAEDKETDKQNLNDNDADGWSDGGGGGGVENSSSYKVEEEAGMHQQQIQYPLRPGAEDCNFYMRMGTCKFGFTCKFNHPPRDSTIQAVNQKPRLKIREDHSDRLNQTECKYYLSAGGCKYGNACRFNHSKERPVVAPVLEYNFLGLPIRLGEKECSYFVRNGSCKYGANCRFNHPDPTGVSDSPSGYANGEQAPSWSPPMTLSEAASFIPESYSSAQVGLSQGSKWNQGPIFSQDKNFRPSAFESNSHPMVQNAFSHFQPQLPIEEFPERPGQPECTYFIKTGDCKFRSGCKFHHPKDRIAQPSCAVTEKGLPLRPGQSICTHYSNYGICKFGPKCRYDHPPNIQHMAPELADQAQHPASTNFASPGDSHYERGRLH